VPFKPGVTATPAGPRPFATEQMAPCEYPPRGRLVPCLPSGPTGKILRREGQLPEDFR
jgi:hypothetical protein